MKQNRFYPIAYVSHGANDLYWFILPLVLPYLLKHFNLPYASGGAILTGYMLTVALFSFFLGKFSDKIVRWRMLTLGFLIASLGFTALGITSLGAVDLGNGLPLFIVILLATAVGVSSFHPTMYALLDEHTLTNRGTVFGRYEMWGTTAILIMYLINGYLFKFIGWQGALMVAAVPGFVMVVLLPALRQSLEVSKEKKKEEKEITGEERGKRKVSYVVIFLVSAMLRVMSAVAVLNFLPTYFTLGLQMQPLVSSYMAGFFFIGGIASGFLFGRIAAKKGFFSVMVFFSAGVGAAIVLLSLVIIPWLLPIITFIFGFVMSGCVPAQNLILTSLSTKSGRGETFGILLGALTFTSSLSPLLLGLLADAVGLRRAIGIFSIPAFAGWLLYLVLYLILKSYGYRDLSEERLVH